MTLENDTYEARQNRDKACQQWLNQELLPSVKRLLWLSAGGLYLSRVVLILQLGVLSVFLHQVVIEHQSWLQLTEWLWAFAGLAVIRALFVFQSSVSAQKAAEQIKLQLRSQLNQRYQQLGPRYSLYYATADLTTASLEQVEALEGYFSRYRPLQYLLYVLPLTMIGIVGSINWVAGLILALTGPLIPLFMILIGMGTAALQKERFTELNRLSGYFLDRIQGLETLKIFANSTLEIQALQQMSDQFRQKTMAVLRVAFLSSTSLEFFSAVAVALVAVYIGLGLLGLIDFAGVDELSLQQALFILMISPEFFAPLRQLAAAYHDRSAALGAADHLMHLLQDVFEPSPAVHPVNSAYALECHNLSKSYRDQPVFQHFNLRIERGEKVALTGPSGAGKSALLQLFLGYNQPTEGGVFVLGHGAKRSVSEQNIAWMGPQSRLFEGTLAENIYLNTPLDEQKLGQVMQLAGVDEFIASLPKGVQTRIGEKGYGLSGGQIRRILLARCFYKSAPVLLLDEPTAHIDALSKELLLQGLEHILQGRTVLVVTHDPEVMERMDRVIALP